MQNELKFLQEQNSLLREVIEHLQSEHHKQDVLTLTVYEPTQSPMKIQGYGGWRPNSGRKTNAERERLASLATESSESSETSSVSSDKIRKPYRCKCGWNGLYKLDGTESKTIINHRNKRCRLNH